MKLKAILIAILTCACTISLQAQKDSHARKVLDRTASLFNTNGIEIKFNLRTSTNGQNQNSTQGTITLKGNKFHLETPAVTTWFNGTTQWSYLTDSQEVNISNPTSEELQSINPYAFIGLYKQGYNYNIGKHKTYKGKAVEEISLHAESPRQDIQAITLYINSSNAYPLYIKITDRNKNSSEIEVESLKKGLNLPDNRFVFDTKQYPNAEIIDLR